jgi:hypothetical protein
MHAYVHTYVDTLLMTKTKYPKETEQDQVTNKSDTYVHECDFRKTKLAILTSITATHLFGHKTYNIGLFLKKPTNLYPSGIRSHDLSSYLLGGRRIRYH